MHGGCRKVRRVDRRKKYEQQQFAQSGDMDILKWQIELTVCSTKPFKQRSCGVSCLYSWNWRSKFFPTKMLTIYYPKTQVPNTTLYIGMKFLLRKYFSEWVEKVHRCRWGLTPYIWHYSKEDPICETKGIGIIGTESLHEQELMRTSSFISRQKFFLSDFFSKWKQAINIPENECRVMDRKRKDAIKVNLKFHFKWT